jgi:hypothetical protein
MNPASQSSPASLLARDGGPTAARNDGSEDSRAACPGGETPRRPQAPPLLRPGGLLMFGGDLHRNRIARKAVRLGQRGCQGEGQDVVRAILPATLHPAVALRGDTRSSTRRSRRHLAVRSAIFMHTACPARTVQQSAHAGGSDDTVLTGTQGSAC